MYSEKLPLFCPMKTPYLFSRVDVLLPFLPAGSVQGKEWECRSLSFLSVSTLIIKIYSSRNNRYHELFLLLLTQNNLSTTFFFSFSSSSLFHHNYHHHYHPSSSSSSSTILSTYSSSRAFLRSSHSSFLPPAHCSFSALWYVGALNLHPMFLHGEK